ncbi:MAG TPA: futalosine hydrolase, partial [Deinococcales bacterium]|nr:futalosine hydrolase [Deinococcales bacterium]
MTGVPHILIAVATPLEARSLPALPGARVVVTGVGAVNAALGVALEAQRERPALVVNAGVGGAYPGGGVPVGGVVVASSVIFAALGS